MQLTDILNIVLSLAAIVGIPVLIYKTAERLEKTQAAQHVKEWDKRVSAKVTPNFQFVLLAFVMVLLVLYGLWRFGGYVAVYLAPQSGWAYFWQYSIDSEIYPLGLEDIHIEPKPHDCEFLAAPIGNKNCHYQITVQPVKWRDSNTTRGAVFVSFSKVDD